MVTMEPGMFSNLLGRWEPCLLVQSLADSVSTLYTAMWLLALAVMRPSPFALKVKAVKGAESCRSGISEEGFRFSASHMKHEDQDHEDCKASQALQ